MSIDFRILGPLEVVCNGRAVRLAGRIQRALLALLVLRANAVVPADVIVEELWPSQRPADARNTLQVHVSKLRRALAAGGESPLVTRAPGYLLAVEPDRLDAARFESLLHRGREQLERRQAERAAEMLHAALAEWRGDALADVADEPFAQAEIARLEELRLEALEERIEADLALARHDELVAELQALVEQRPLRERLRRQLIVALYRAGRQAEALEEYRRVRRALVEDLGLEPTPALRRLEQAILRQEEWLESPTPPPGRRRRLPVAPTPLVGRDDEVAAVCSTLRRGDVRLVTLTGPGGIGKTRLALAVAEKLEPELADGAVFVDLGAVSRAAHVVPTVAQALEVPRTDAPLSDAIAGHLRDRSLLLVLDNFEHVLPAAPAISVLLSGAAGVKVLVTSREAVRLAGEHELPVPPLEVPRLAGAVDPAEVLATPSAQLFLQRARAHVAGLELAEADVRAVAELCVRLEGLPLAIELAAAHVKLLPVTAILDRVGRRLDLLAAGPVDAPARQRTMRAAIDWSYELLEPHERTLLAALSVFAGGWTLEAAEAVSGLGNAVLDGLASLVNKSLVERAGPDRFAMLEVIRQYARERLAAGGDELSVRRRHGAHYLELAEHADAELGAQGEAEWLERLEQEHDNLRAALAFAFETGDGEIAVRLTGALRRFWQIRGHVIEGRRALERALALTPGGPETLRARALNGAGILAGEQGDFEAGRKYFEECHRHAAAAGDDFHVGAALANLGNLAMFAGDYEGAEAAFRAAIEHWQETGDRRSLGVAYENLGCVALCVGDDERAEELLERSLEVAESFGDLHNVSSSQRGLARIALLRGDVDRAERLFRESLELARALDERHGIAECFEGFAFVAGARSAPGRAADLLAAADALRESIAARRRPDVQVWYERSVAALGEPPPRRLSVDEALALAASQ